MKGLHCVAILLAVFLAGAVSEYSYDDIPQQTKGRMNFYDEGEVHTSDSQEEEEADDDSLEYRIVHPRGLWNGYNSTHRKSSADQCRCSQQCKIIEILSHQLQLTQLAMEEKVRSDGASGIKQIRVLYNGDRPYYSGHHSGYAVAAIHEHVDNIRTLGSGEFVVVLNGVEFRTRHNDFMLRKPHSTSKIYHKTELVEFPDVPPEVLNQTTVEDEITEMREWFKAFANQDFSVRDYRKYFKPVMCYLEGAWTKFNDALEEPFYSDRHFVDASTWKDLEQKVMFTSYTGRKDIKENYAHLPTKMIDIDKCGMPIIAQWNYRIMCHPLKADLPTNKLHPVDDLAPRKAENQNFTEYVNSRAARFELHNDPFSYDVGLLDKIMSEIPGKDNYQGYIEDDGFDLKAYDKLANTKKPINAAFYHRYFFNDKKGAMGSVDQKRAFSDRNLFVAMTTQDRVYGSKVEKCELDKETKRTNCKKYHQRMSYAIPFELVYLTPLSKWNPRNIEYKGEYDSAYGKTIKGKKGNRNGEFTKEKALNGTNSWYFYRTPAEFFAEDARLEGEPADTASDYYGILDKDGNVRKMSPSGHHIMLPEIDGIGKIRLRYPVVPVHGEGSGVWKELEALKDIVMEMGKNMHLFRDPPTVPEQVSRQV